LIVIGEALFTVIIIKLMVADACPAGSTSAGQHSDLRDATHRLRDIVFRIAAAETVAMLYGHDDEEPVCRPSPDGLTHQRIDGKGFGSSTDTSQKGRRSGSLRRQNSGKLADCCSLACISAQRTPTAAESAREEWRRRFGAHCA